MQSKEPVLRVLEHRSFDGGIVVSVQGDVDLSSIDILQRPLHDVCRRTSTVTVDLRRVDFIECVGMRTLLELSAEGEQRGCRVEFIQGPEQVARVFELTGIGARLQFIDADAPPATAAAAAV